MSENPIESTTSIPTDSMDDSQAQDRKRSHSQSQSHCQSAASADVNVMSAVVATPLTLEGEKPQKRFYRQRAHCNPLSHNDTFEYPLCPESMDWTTDLFPGMPPGTQPTVLDVGCGFGGLTLALAKLLPDQVILGMEIRAKVRQDRARQM